MARGEQTVGDSERRTDDLDERARAAGLPPLGGGAAVVLVYVWLGGFWAASVTDSVHSSLEVTDVSVTSGTVDCSASAGHDG